jgi:hypothetical protein
MKAMHKILLLPIKAYDTYSYHSDSRGLILNILLLDIISFAYNKTFVMT